MGNIDLTETLGADLAPFVTHEPRGGSPGFFLLRNEHMRLADATPAAYDPRTVCTPPLYMDWQTRTCALCSAEGRG